MHKHVQGIHCDILNRQKKIRQAEDSRRQEEEVLKHALGRDESLDQSCCSAILCDRVSGYS